MNANMGMDLSGKSGYFRFSTYAWHAALALAHKHGWDLLGSEPPRQRYANWGGEYLTNSHQAVSDEDAANIADALELALDDVPDEGGGDHLLTPAQHQAAYRGELSPEEFKKAAEQFMDRQAASPPRIPPQTPAWYFAGNKDYLREFITFCRAGGFSVD